MCSKGKVFRQTQFMCGSCEVPLCMSSVSDCHSVWHTQPNLMDAWEGCNERLATVKQGRREKRQTLNDDIDLMEFAGADNGDESDDNLSETMGLQANPPPLPPLDQMEAQQAEALSLRTTDDDDVRTIVGGMTNMWSPAQGSQETTESNYNEGE